MGFFAYTPDQFLIQVKVSFFSILPFYQSFKSLLLLLLLLFFCYIKCLIMIIITIADYYYYWFFSNNNQQYYCFFCSFSTCSDLPLFPNFIFFSFLFWFVFCLCFYFCCFLSLFCFVSFCLCFFLFLFLFYFWLSNYFSDMKRLSLVNCCLFVYLICFFSWNCWVKIHNLIAFLQFPKIYSFICLLLFSYNFTFHFESYYFCCYSFYYQLILAYLMAVTSQQNVFIASSLGSFLTMPINSGPELCWENTPGCLETFYTLMLSILFLIN